MKQFFVLLLACCCAYHATAQKFRMVDTTNRWLVLEDVGSGDVQRRYFDLRLGVGALINGLQYMQMLDATTGLPANGSRYIGTYYREDTVNGRVYCINMAANDTAERVIFDRNWKPDDTAFWYSDYPTWTTERYSVVRQIDSTLINGDWYRTFLMESKPSGAFYYVLEGIGSLNGPGFPTLPLTSGNSILLRCFLHNGSKPVLSPSVGKFDNTGFCYLSVAESAPAEQVCVTPNPADKNAMVHLPSAEQFVRCQIIDEIGRQLAAIEITGKNQVPIGPYLQAPGIYLLVLTNASGQRVVRKFVFEN